MEEKQPKIKELRERVESPTPKWFKRIVKIGLCVAAGGAALKVGAASLEGFKLNTWGELICNYAILLGLVAAAVAKTAKQKDAE